MRKPETRLVTRILIALHQQWPEGYFFKVHGGPFQRAGLPDIIGCVEGLFFGLEVKLEGGNYEPLQRHEAGKIERAGGIAACVRSPEETIAVVRAALPRAKTRR